MWYALLSVFVIGAITALVLYAQRNQARFEVDGLSKTVSSQADQLQKLHDLVTNLQHDIDQLTQERNELAKKDPASAGDVLSGVLTSST